MSDSDVQLLYQSEINVGHDPIVSKHKMVQEKQRTREISHVENLRLDSFGRLMVRWFGRLAWLAVSERSERADKQTGKVNSFVSSERRG